MKTSKFGDHGHYPKEYFVPFTNPDGQSIDSVYEGRITLVQAGKSEDGLWIEVEIVFCETKKIYHSVGRKIGPNNDEQAISVGMQMLAHFMQRVKNEKALE
jgi:hypothetical protein